MNRSKRTAVVFSIALFLASAASLGVYRIVSRLPTGPVEAPTVETVVARHPLKLGTRVTSDHVKLVKWPVDSKVPNSFSKIEDVVQRGLISDLGENEPLTESKLAPLEAGAGLPPSIPPGMRAVSVKVNEVVGVAGFVVPGTRVDVMVTLTSRQQNDRQPDARGRQQRTGADGRHALRPGKGQGGRTDSVDGRHAPCLAAGRRADCAGGVRGTTHARSPQPARHDPDTDDGRADRGPLRSARTRGRTETRTRPARTTGETRSWHNLHPLPRRRPTRSRRSGAPNEQRK